MKPTNKCILIAYNNMVFEYLGVRPKVYGYYITELGTLKKIITEDPLLITEDATMAEVTTVAENLKNSFITNCEFCLHKFNYKLNKFCNESYYPAR